MNRRKDLSVVTVTASQDHFLSEAVLVLLHKVESPREFRDMLTLHEVPMLAVEVSEELAAEEISELLSDYFSRGLTLKYLHPLIKVVMLVQDKLPSLPSVSTWPLPAGSTGRAWWPLVAR